MYLGYNNRMSKRLCRRRRIRSYKTACSEKRAAKVSGDNNKYICQFFPCNTSSIGFPAVPAGSPSSLILSAAGFLPITYAQQ